MKLLSVNAGSSTLKFRLYEMPEEKVLMKGTFDRIGLEGSNYSIRIGDEKIGKDVEIKNHGEAVQLLLKELIAQKMIQKNIPMEQICEITGLDKKEIENLIK